MMKNNFKNFIMLFTVLLLSNSTVMAATKAQSELRAFGSKLVHIFLGVIISIVVIYVALIAYKRFKNPYIQTVLHQNDKQNTLLSSENLDDAIEHFIKDSE